MRKNLRNQLRMIDLFFNLIGKKLHSCPNSDQNDEKYQTYDLFKEKRKLTVRTDRLN